MVPLLKARCSAIAALTALTFAAPIHAAETIDVKYIEKAPVIDGVIDKQWAGSQWMPINNLILGTQPTPEDFSGQFKLRWDENYLYLVAKIKDDVLADNYPNPTEHYWDDDSLEIFLDPDSSGGDHRYSYNAFAYHLALDGNSVDIGDKPGQIVLLNDHTENQWARNPENPYEIVWEVKIKFYAPEFSSQGEKSRITLSDGHLFGFMLAYCDADGKGQREHFVGSNKITPINGDIDLGYKTADVFSKMKLVK